MNAFARERVKVRGERCDERFAFARFHFRYSALVQTYSADNLYFVVLHSEHPHCRFARYSESVV